MLLLEVNSLAIWLLGSIIIDVTFWAGEDIRLIILALNSSKEGSLARKLILSLSIFSPLKPPPIILNFSNFFSKLTATLAGATGSDEYATAVGPLNKSEISLKLVSAIASLDTDDYLEPFVYFSGSHTKTVYSTGNEMKFSAFKIIE